MTTGDHLRTWAATNGTGQLKKGGDAYLGHSNYRDLITEFRSDRALVTQFQEPLQSKEDFLALNLLLERRRIAVKRRFHANR